jgi:RNA recognition motif-containing protein
MDSWIRDVFVPAMALAWFVLGILLGMRLTPRRQRFGGTMGKSPSWPRRDGGEAFELYVGNLAANVSEAEVRSVFGQAGSVLNIRLLTTRDGEKTKRFGFVTMATRDAAEGAIRSFNGREVQGQVMVVSPARSRRRRSRG